MYLLLTYVCILFVAERRALYKKDPNSVPVVLEVDCESSMPDGFLAPLLNYTDPSSTVASFRADMCDRCIYPSGSVIRYYIGEDFIGDLNESLKDLHDKYKDEDGALYLSYRFSDPGKAEVSIDFRSFINQDKIETIPRDFEFKCKSAEFVQKCKETFQKLRESVLDNDDIPVVIQAFENTNQFNFFNIFKKNETTIWDLKILVRKRFKLTPF